MNLLGSPSKLDELKKNLLRKNIILLEDNCESMGAELNGLKSGQYGNISTHSTFLATIWQQWKEEYAVLMMS